jgi:nucleotide-binding universal stress UspA family protein
MAGTSRSGADPTVAPPPFLEKLLHASQRGRGVSRLMVATDFSMCADLAVARALRLPLSEGGSLTLFHAVHPEAGRGDSSWEERCLSRVAGAARRRLRTRQPVVVKEELRVGEVAEEATTVAQALGVDLVIAGRPHAARGRELTARGANVRHLVRRLEAPLLVVGAHPVRAYQRPLVGVDLSEDSRRALELVLRLCPAPVGVDVLHVPPPCAGPEPRHAGLDSWEEWLAVRQELEAAARKELGHFLAPYRELGREFTVSLRCGEPLEEALVEEAVERRSDLLALGMQEDSGAALPVPGLVERVVMRARCDVLVAKVHPPR